MALFKDETGRTGRAHGVSARIPTGRLITRSAASKVRGSRICPVRREGAPTTAHWAQASASIGGTAGLSRRAATRKLRSETGREARRPERVRAGRHRRKRAGVVLQRGRSGRATRGGAWTDDTFHAGWIIRKDPFDRDATHGFRLVRTFDDAAAHGRQPDAATELRDYRKEKPVAESEFAIFRRLYEYEKLALNRRGGGDRWTSSTGFVKRSPSISRMAASEAAPTLLPRNAQRPLQTVIYWPHGGFTRSSQWTMSS